MAKTNVSAMAPDCPACEVARATALQVAGCGAFAYCYCKVCGKLHKGRPRGRGD